MIGQSSHNFTDVQLNNNNSESINQQSKDLINKLGCSICNLRRFKSLNKLYMPIFSQRLIKAAFPDFEPVSVDLRMRESRSVVSRYDYEEFTQHLMYVEECV